MHIDNPGRYPALIAGVVQAALALAIALGVHMGAHTEGIVDAAIAAAAGLVTGCFVRPFPVPTLVGFLNALVAVGVAFKWPHATAGLTVSVDAFAVMVAALFIHTQGSPRLESRVRNRPIPVE